MVRAVLCAWSVGEPEGQPEDEAGRCADDAGREAVRGDDKPDVAVGGP